jgi:ribosomal protein S21
MADLEDVLKKEESFDPDKAFNRMLELNNKASELAHSNKEDALKELKEIVKEITRLAKMRKDFYENLITELKLKQEDNN